MSDMKTVEPPWTLGVDSSLGKCRMDEGPIGALVGGLPQQTPCDAVLDEALTPQLACLDFLLLTTACCSLECQSLTLPSIAGLRILAFSVADVQ